MAPVEKTIINAIENLNKSTFSGAMPFVYFTAHSQKDPITIGTETSYRYNSLQMGKHRFPPLITNLEVKPTGTMGVVREGEVTVKFASMEQMKEFKNFFRIGTAKTITWGWNQNRLDGSNFNLPDVPSDTFSKGIANNIDAWRTQLNTWKYSADILVGPLINFNFTLNEDASVDVVFTVGSPNELVAFMGSHKKNSNEVKSSDADNIAAYRVASLLNLVDAEFSPAIFDKEIRPNLLNYDNTQSTLKKIWEGVTSVFNTIMGDSQYDNVSEDVYASFGTIAQYAINQNPSGSNTIYTFDISEAISVAHPNMISNSENVIFLNKEMATPTVVNNEIKLDKTKLQTFDTIINNISHSYPESGTFDGTYGGTINKFKARNWGYVKNVFFKVPFVQDIIKNNGDGSIVDIVEKLCNEINIASCGLTDLAPQVSSKQTVKNVPAKEVFTVVDYALIPDKINPTPLSLFEKGSNSSTIINISFNCDLPKEIGSMAMLGNRKSTDVGGKLFFDYEKDNVLMTPDRLSDYDYTGGKGPGGGGGGGGGGTPKNYGKIKPGSKLPGALDINGKIIPDPKGLPGKDSKGNDLVWFWDEKNGTPGWFPQLDPTKSAQAKAAANIAGKMLIDESCVFIKYDAAEHTSSKNLDHGVFKAVFKNTDMIKAMYFGDGNHNKNNPLLPIELEITVLGISGIIAGQIIELEKDALPFGNVGIFQVKEVNHTVNDKWETTIKLGFRPTN